MESLQQKVGTLKRMAARTKLNSCSTVEDTTATEEDNSTFQPVSLQTPAGPPANLKPLYTNLGVASGFHFTRVQEGNKSFLYNEDSSTTM